jgi:hypothetical protein
MEKRAVAKAGSGRRAAATGTRGNGFATGARFSFRPEKS